MTELDGMQLSQALDRDTLNGYSGNVPNGFNDLAIEPCDIVNHRLVSYIEKTKQSQLQYDALVSRVIVFRDNPKCSLTYRLQT